MRRAWLAWGAIVAGCTLDYGGGGVPASDGGAPDGSVVLPDGAIVPADEAGAGCPPGYARCPGEPAACTHVASDAQSCGACGHVCSNANGVGACENGKCVFACRAGFGNCDGRDDNGCEASTTIDAKSCGACGHDCGGAACVRGECAPTVLASARHAPLAIAVDATSIYWADVGTSPGYSDGAVVRASKADGSALQALASGAAQTAQPVGIAVDATSVYYADFVGHIFRVAKDGSGFGALYVGQKAPERLVVDDTSITWTNAGTQLGGYADGEVRRGLLDGGAPSELLASGRRHPIGIAADDAGIYFAESLVDGGALSTLPIAADGGVPTTLASIAAHDVALDDANAYVTVPSEGTIYKVAKNGGGKQLLAWGQSLPTGIAVDDAHVYWTNATPGGAVMRMNKDGSGALVLASGRPTPFGIAVDGAAVYWTERGSDTGSGTYDAQDGAVVKVAR